ncbi:sensor histidine kinase [Leptospira sp. WS92.C1]
MELIQEALEDIGDKIRFVEFIPCPVLLSQIKDDQYQTLYLNRSFREMIGYEIKEISTIEEWFLQAYPDDNYRKEIKADWWAEIHHAKRSGKSNASLKAKIKTKYNGKKWLNIRSAEFGELSAVSFQDIDDLETLNSELTRTNSTKTQLLSILAHDLRTPLIQIISLISLFKNAEIGAADLYLHLSKLNIQTHLTIDLIDNTLNWVKANAKNIIVTKISFSPNGILHELIQLYNDYLKTKFIQIEMNLDEGIIIFGDREIFKVIIRNLFVNAIKFSKPGGKIILGAKKLPEKKYQISVSDAGIGMTPEELKRVFSKESFSSPGTFNETGAGLGIKLCRDFAKLTGAEFWLDSEKQKGTSVNLIFS